MGSLAFSEKSSGLDIRLPCFRLTSASQLGRNSGNSGSQQQQRCRLRNCRALSAGETRRQVRGSSRLNKEIRHRQREAAAVDAVIEGKCLGWILKRNVDATLIDVRRHAAENRCQIGCSLTAVDAGGRGESDVQPECSAGERGRRSIQRERSETVWAAQ